MHELPKYCLIGKALRALKIYFWSDSESLSKHLDDLDKHHEDVRHDLARERDALRDLIEKIDTYRVSYPKKKSRER
jgi:hypothetical protein